VKEAVAAVDGIVKQLVLAIRAASGLALVASVLVLAGALGATARMRQRDSVILKTLGASRGTLIATFLIEYALLGCIAVVFALICGTLGARFVVVNLMNFDFAMPWLAVVSMAFSALIGTVTLGLAGTWHILGQKPANYLRHA
jgi:putative ABC transport system permease protein